MDALRTTVPSMTLTCPPPTSKSHPSQLHHRTHAHTNSLLVLTHRPVYQHHKSPSTTDESPTKHVDVHQSRADRTPFVRVTDALMDWTSWCHGQQDRLTFELQTVSLRQEDFTPLLLSSFRDSQPTLALIAYPHSPIKASAVCVVCYYGSHDSVLYSELLLGHEWRSPTERFPSPNEMLRFQSNLVPHHRYKVSAPLGVIFSHATCHEGIDVFHKV